MVAAQLTPIVEPVLARYGIRRGPVMTALALRQP